MLTCSKFEILIQSVLQVIVLSLPARLAANWFGPRQVSTATAVGLFGFQLGIAGSFLLTPVVVRNHPNLEDIGNDLSKLYWFFAIYSSIALLAMVLCKYPNYMPNGDEIHTRYWARFSTVINIYVLLDFHYVRFDAILVIELRAKELG